MYNRSLAGFLLLSLLGGCSGAGQGPATQVRPSAATSVAVPSQVGKPAVVTFTIVIPRAETISDLRAKFVSANTASIGVAPNGGAEVIANVSPGQSTYTMEVRVLSGVNNFVIQLYGAANATAPVLARATTTRTILAGQVNDIDVELAGVTATITLTPSTTTPAIGSGAASARNIPLGVTAQDASGAIIIGPYSGNITLTASSPTTPSLTLTVTSLPDSTTTTTIHYDGTGRDAATFCAAAPGVMPVCATITPTLFVANVVVAPTAASVEAGSGTTLTATVSMSDGTTNGDVTWSSSAATRATVNQSGAVAGVATGNTTITATSNADASQSAAAAVTVTPGPVTISRSRLDFTAAGQTGTFSASQPGYTGVFTVPADCLRTNGVKVASVDPAASVGTFTMTAMAAGVCTATVTGEGGRTSAIDGHVTTTSFQLQ